VDVLLRDTLPLREGRVVSDLERDFDLESDRLPERLSEKSNTPQGTTSHVLIVSSACATAAPPSQGFSTREYGERVMENTENIKSQTPLYCAKHVTCLTLTGRHCWLLIG
jgi:hypothetical protein